ncbi:hypothetical protein CHIBA101_0038 [Actinomyces sp. Chiba101]|uniref:Peptide zinc metalloprotease protein n=1 Tax=Actinomyces denticolens TaxID=52767 RepID=A0ABY1IAF0_9ACTO|nr:MULTISPECIES: PqqD family protein [Actinomyces]BAW91916.1 hypothetical protein CHIBA101_0038 [Actinomyces sp. Chiba101]GAV95158.1 hypothetical protein ADENT20671_1939 [Actinomyces denticolens]SHI87169.1 putative peptide zinc metalloprotease protein [Actinomyces denticolens]SUU12663.1 Uncharacterised protein [Actinomyces denticolens]
MTATTDIPRLRQGVSLIVGMDNQPMLFDSDSGKYHRLGAAAAFIVGQFDGRRSLPAIIEQLPQKIDAAGAQRINGLVDSLRGKQLLSMASTAAPSAPLVAPRPHPERRPRFARGRHVAPVHQGRHVRVHPSRWSGGWLLPRFMLCRSYHRVVAPIVRLLRRLPARSLAVVFILAAVAGYAAGVLALLNLAGGARPTLSVIIIAIAIQLMSIVGHESWHAIVAGWLGPPVRGLGVALMFWVIPIAYVDRTDSYRVRSRLGLAMLALAGMCSDGVVCGIEAAVAASSGGVVRQVALTLCAFQLTMLVTNSNPLTQSDGVAAIEALTGSVNLRGRSMLVLRCALRRVPLPPALAVMRRSARWGYFLYGLLAALLGITVMVMSLTSLGLILFNLVRGLLA